jgi:Bacterial extracellular solute-binding protein
MIERASAGKSRLWPVGRSARAHWNGEKADLFASANMGHRLKLAADGLAMRIDMFTRNALCTFARPKVGLTLANFLERLLDPAVRFGTSTPKADPADDYTWLMFYRADGVHPGAFSILDQKAQKIVGGAWQNSVPVKDPVVESLTAGKVDVMIDYCGGRQHLHPRGSLLVANIARRSANRGAEDAHIVAAGDLARLLGGEAAAQHRGDKMHPAGVVLDATARVELVGADADMIHANDVGHLLQAVDISVEARKEMPDPD